jgi:hypothetical protein
MQKLSGFIRLCIACSNDWCNSLDIETDCEPSQQLELFEWQRKKQRAARQQRSDRVKAGRGQTADQSQSMKAAQFR